MKYYGCGAGISFGKCFSCENQNLPNERTETQSYSRDNWSVELHSFHTRPLLRWSMWIHHGNNMEKFNSNRNIFTCKMISHTIACNQPIFLFTFQLPYGIVDDGSFGSILVYLISSFKSTYLLAQTTIKISIEMTNSSYLHINRESCERFCYHRCRSQCTHF